MSIEKVAWKCVNCGDLTYYPGLDPNTPGIEVRQTTHCLKCLRLNQELGPTAAMIKQAGAN